MVVNKIIGYKEALKRLKSGEEIHWTSGMVPIQFFATGGTVRFDTFHKLWKDGHITDYGYHKLHGTVKYKK